MRRKFSKSRLGAFWYILHPLIQAAIYSLVLSELMRSRLPGVNNNAGFAIYLMAGMAAWGLFSEIVVRCTTIFIDYAPMLKKIAFPRICLPIIVGGGALINHFLLLLAIAVIFAFFGIFPTIAWLYISISILIIAVFSFGLGILLGTLNVFNRDISQFFTVVIQIWFWLTPIVYTIDILPIKMQWIVGINPLTPLIKIYQDAFVYGLSPDWASLLFPALCAGIIFILGFLIFKRASVDLVDEL